MFAVGIIVIIDLNEFLDIEWELFTIMVVTYICCTKKLNYSSIIITLDTVHSKNLILIPILIVFAFGDA